MVSVGVIESINARSSASGAYIRRVGVDQCLCVNFDFVEILHRISTHKFARRLRHILPSSDDSGINVYPNLALGGALMPHNSTPTQVRFDIGLVWGHEVEEMRIALSFTS